ncbi:hypothetical protein HKBW3S06_00011 [Candidatus Hakubella thermalkaliphila]|uniref:Uncharacterized protein n=1 Tax=Candidatus Hakubella thermalkaliphila TaxID=2754717 RepID=A0A6V8NXI3_9ACTN|nr:hypothetical protein [Candidatus Hakubella thermalkaliphila]GFP20784.1 hypothetical protein HKBW3S06_00011 [Candidatus Hakubella thermalkaliphila]GFP24743.1 hypothetical protein HKBW3S25_00180 [Candidatus Hakubella thermalkaliphila]
MNGLFSDAGFIYQRKVTLYHILEAILNRDLSDSKIEVTLAIRPDSDETYSLDFLIVSNKQTQRFFEVKDRTRFCRKSEIRPILANFYNTYRGQNFKNCEFTLVHSCQIKGFLEKIYTDKKKAVESILGNVSNLEIFCDVFTPKQILNAVDMNLKRGDLDLRSIAMCDEILKQLSLREYGIAEIVYQALLTCYENVVQEKSNELKAKAAYTANATFPLGDSVQVELYRLINFNNSFIDQVESKFPNRNEAITHFYTLFAIPNLPKLKVSP